MAEILYVACPLCGATVKQSELKDGLCAICQLFKETLKEGGKCLVSQ